MTRCLVQRAPRRPLPPGLRATWAAEASHAQVSVSPPHCRALFGVNGAFHAAVTGAGVSVAEFLAIRTRDRGTYFISPTMVLGVIQQGAAYEQAILAARREGGLPVLSYTWELGPPTAEAPDCLVPYLQVCQNGAYRADPSVPGCSTTP